MQDLGTLGGASSIAYAVNASGQVVGSAQGANAADRAFLWQNGALSDLNAAIAPGMGWYLEEAAAINGSGQIAGWGTLNGDTDAFLLTPLVTDLSVTVSAAPTPATTGGQLVYTIQVSNHGADTATGVTLVNTLGSGAVFVSSNPAPVSSGGTLRFSLGSLPAGGQTTVQITVHPTAVGTLTNVVAVSGDQFDSNVGNNTSSLSTAVAAVGPDLTGSCIHASLVQKGAARNAKYLADSALTIRNIGTVSSGTYTVQFYLSSDRKLNGGDISLGTFRLRSLAAGQSQNFRFRTKKPLPYSELTGKYLIAVLDPQHSVAETDSTNNVFVSSALQ